uniref:Uncharacterized protein n=1 Tax=Oryza brachyantha TaxID=4533 RepID=J3MNM8_ORYBR
MKCSGLSSNSTNKKNWRCQKNGEKFTERKGYLTTGSVGPQILSYSSRRIMFICSQSHVILSLTCKSNPRSICQWKRVR